MLKRWHMCFSQERLSSFLRNPKPRIEQCLSDNDIFLTLAKRPIIVQQWVQQVCDRFLFFLSSLLAFRLTSVGSEDLVGRTAAIRTGLVLTVILPAGWRGVLLFLAVAMRAWSSCRSFTALS